MEISEGTWEEVLGHWFIEGRTNEEAFDQLMKDVGEEGEPPSLVAPVERLFDNLEVLLGIV